ncbi:metal ABC transporter permease [Enterococcus pallens]|uniref:ABC transporter permease n=1 Tax=Enterococcus pallens ATCC BAA-351 TaxID=1158607 RepID=R2QJI1_9ENTE|nr:metal ABC transporter permease [Enterococcus pallens]EOH95333.1 ABC transporter permease [Enterococcus pallens ATCC BAA-351]EOU21530.1 ABC transporter permease [Enterococcus pallens ATCC BAA-351]
MALLSYEFMIRAFLAGIFIAGIAPMLGVFLVIRRQSLMADTLSHVSLAGVALGFFLNLNPTATTLLVVVIAAIIMEYLQNMYSSYSEISIAILMAAGLAIALVLMKLAPGSSAVSIQSYLFGSIITVTWPQVGFLGALFVLVSILFLLFKRPMYVLTFDEDIAAVDGLPVRLMSMIFNVVTGVAIAVMIPIAGALLISAIMIVPAATGMRAGKSFNAVILISVIIGLVGIISGLTGSFYMDIPPGATITLCFIGLFLLMNVFRRVKMMLQRKRNQND